MKKFLDLSKKEKIKIKKEFFQTDKGNNIKVRLKRLFIIGILGIIFSIFLYVTHSNIWEIISSISLLLASIFFIISSIYLYIRNLNNYLNKKK